ncbi:Ankyrin repeat domain-containing protein 50 [Labeo rohita]|uniref:Ankyrin repeat domain-containing protein 50 n=1 Tax=Labeo rohita TaxID=84645 RepID=A0ABQ8M4A2_LABRO|nr:Ankyrin repeat domain-containing protein 50 [Labeo rohita]
MFVLFNVNKLQRLRAYVSHNYISHHPLRMRQARWAESRLRRVSVCGRSSTDKPTHNPSGKWCFISPLKSHYEKHCDLRDMDGFDGDLADTDHGPDQPAAGQTLLLPRVGLPQDPALPSGENQQPQRSRKRRAAQPRRRAGKGGSWGVLLVGGPGSGKTALCTELLWPSSVHGVHRGLHQHCLGFHFCRAEDSDTLCVSGFVRGLVSQIRRSGLVPEYEEKVREPAVQSALQPGECERNPAETFKRSHLQLTHELCELYSSVERQTGLLGSAHAVMELMKDEQGGARCVLLPLLSCKAPSQSLFVLVDSVDEGCLSGDRDQRSANIAELLAAHHELFPPWLLLVCSARRQNKHITKLFTGDDLYLNLASEPEC